MPHSHRQFTEELTVFADYFQIYVQDDSVAMNFPDDMWSPENIAVGLTTWEGGLVVSTLRNTDTEITIEFATQAPKDIKHYDKAVHASVELPSGQLGVFSITGEESDTNRPTVRALAGLYEVMLLVSGTDTVSSDGLTGNDHYRLVFWPGKKTARKVIK